MNAIVKFYGYSMFNDKPPNCVLKWMHLFSLLQPLVISGSTTYMQFASKNAEVILSKQMQKIKEHFTLNIIPKTNKSRILKRSLFLPK